MSVMRSLFHACCCSDNKQEHTAADLQDLLVKREGKNLCILYKPLVPFRLLQQQSVNRDLPCSVICGVFEDPCCQNAPESVNVCKTKISLTS